MSVLTGVRMGAGFELSRYFDFFANGTFFLHFFTPVIAIYSVIWLEESKEKVTKKSAWLGLIPTVVYSILYCYEVVIVGFKNGGWPDFYGFTFGGNYKMVPVSALGMYLATYLIARVELYMASKKERKAE